MASCNHLETSARSGIRKEWVALTQAQGAKDASWNVCSTCLASERDTRMGNGISSTTKTHSVSSPVAGGVMD